jgi:hypothetical protein
MKDLRRLVFRAIVIGIPISIKDEVKHRIQNKDKISRIIGGILGTIFITPMILISILKRYEHITGIVIEKIEESDEIPEGIKNLILEGVMTQMSDDAELLIKEGQFVHVNGIEIGLNKEFNPEKYIKKAFELSRHKEEWSKKIEG